MFSYNFLLVSFEPHHSSYSKKKQEREKKANDHVIWLISSMFPLNDLNLFIRCARMYDNKFERNCSKQKDAKEIKAQDIHHMIILHDRVTF